MTQGKGAFAPLHDEYHVPTRDEQGHYERLTFRIPPLYVAQMEEILRTRLFYPSGSREALIRHAIHRHIQWLHGQAPLPTLMPQIEMINTIVRAAEYKDAGKAMFSSLEKSVAAHIDSGDMLIARRIVAEAKAYLDTMPEGLWKDKFQREFKRKFGELLAGKAAKINKFGDDEGEW